MSPTMILLTFTLRRMEILSDDTELASGTILQ